LGGDCWTTFVPKSSVVTVTPKSDKIKRATFHLFNFPKFSGPDDYISITGTPPHSCMKTCGHAILKADGWVVTIAAMDRTDDMCEALNRQGGFVITHMGRIERQDGSTFSSEQLKQILRALHAFLSFSLGRWAGVAFPVGFDQGGNRVFEQWGLPLTAPGKWNGTFSWFDNCHGESLSETFPGFMTLWKDDKWHGTLWKAVYWYLIANGESGAGGHTDAGIILAQTALELLAWTHCVEDRMMVSAKAFEKGLTAADNLRLLSSSLGIPASIPDCLPTLQSVLQAQKGCKWQDAMDAITSVRNSLVHPHIKTSFPEDACFEAWNLSMWYIDMVLLRLCGHKGKYGNRLILGRCAGTVEAVPWSSNDTGKAGA
jgi:hypothetical protein